MDCITHFKDFTWSSIVEMNEDCKHGVLGVGEVVEVLTVIYILSPQYY